MKLKIFSYVILVNLLISGTLASTIEFEKLFKLESYGHSLILSKKDNIKLPASNLSSIERLYRYIQLFCELELYLTDENSTLVIVPHNRLNLFYSTAVCIKLLHQADGKHFIFTTVEKPEAISQQVCTSSNNSAIEVEIDYHSVPIKQFLANDNTIKYLTDQLEYGMLDLPSQIFFATLLKPIYTCDYLINIDYDQYQLPCLFKANTKNSSKYYLLSKLVASDLSCYLHKTYNCIKDRIQNYRGKQQTQATESTDTLVIVEEVLETEVSEVTCEQQDISKATPPAEPLPANSAPVEPVPARAPVASPLGNSYPVEPMSANSDPVEPVPARDPVASPPENASPVSVQRQAKRYRETQVSHLHPSLPNKAITANINLTTGKVYY